MSDTIPKFRKGDHVRIMQVPTAERKGVANKHGIVASIDNGWITVELLGGKFVSMPASSLMRSPRHMSRINGICDHMKPVNECPICSAPKEKT